MLEGRGVVWVSEVRRLQVVVDAPVEFLMEGEGCCMRREG